MKEFKIGLSEPEGVVDSRYDFTPEEMDQYTKDLSNKIEEGVRKNAIRDTESRELASEFRTTPMP